MSARITLGVDVGGTFTDVFALNEASGQIHISKVPSTREDQSQGFIHGVQQALAQHQAPFAAIATVIHGTTVGTNALLERKVARTGLITTRGFRDVLEMRRRDRPTTWGLWGSFEPLIARNLRLEVDERTLADGTIRQPVERAQVLQAADELLAAGCEALCIFFINSYANAANEAAALDCLSAHWPNAHITASHQILPEVREFERASTASLNAALQPIVGRYVSRLESALSEQESTGALLIVQSNGGLMSVASTSRFPVRTALSGPAAGVIACAHIAQAAGFDNVITGDVGGTSFDVSLIADGKIAQAAQQSIAFGMVIRTPMIEIQTIGAGGGSIARVDASGLLQVGPESAGSVPGPVCYGLRETAPHEDGMGPTVTDANVVLGRINPQRPIGATAGATAGAIAGAISGAAAGVTAGTKAGAVVNETLDTASARESIRRHVAEPLGLTIELAAEAILTVANANMAGAIRLVSIERGHDPDRFAYMPFGGGGALHVCAMLRDVGVARGLIPRYPGVSSALGCAIADMQHDFVQTLNVPLNRLDPAKLQAIVAEQERSGRNALADAGVQFQATDVRTELDMLYQGQTHTVAVALQNDLTDTPDRPLRQTVQRAFEATYEQVFGKALANVPIRIMNLRVSVIGRRHKFDLSLLAPPADSGQTVRAHEQRQVHHDNDWYTTPVYQRLELPAQTSIAGPALFEQADTTIWLEPGFTATVDPQGNLLINRTTP